ncbi:MAG: hypothetical protein WA997_04310 [Anaerolineales bacterium]|nr:hypothetical protein [Anaerolineales bacterium]HUV29404.1 hypothetical protein [Anaerolineales bacterium]
MEKNPVIPDSSTMPDDQSEKIDEVLNNKPITPEDELSDALEEMARDIALVELFLEG